MNSFDRNLPNGTFEIDIGGGQVKRLLCVFGTRPETIKFAPVIAAIEDTEGLEAVTVNTAQHRDLIRPLIAHFGIRVGHDLNVMREGQTLNGIASRVLEKLDTLLADLQPDAVLVQGDTTTAMAGALAAWNRRIPVGHIEAGLRTDSAENPFPEEMNRRLITRMASWHFASTEANRRALLDEQVSADTICLSGNPVIDSLHWTLRQSTPSTLCKALLEKVGDRRFVVLTTHRRESFGTAMRDNLKALRKFIDEHEDLALVFPVHPNPSVRCVAEEVLGDCERVLLTDPMAYPDFLQLLARSWLLVSDSGGLQEEAPSLGKALLILRENTERPEAVEAGVARLIGGGAKQLQQELASLYEDDAWIRGVAEIANPFGDGHAGPNIASWLACELGVAVSGDREFGIRSKSSAGDEILPGLYR